ncbi:DUF192 domain-containing protein [Hoeflea prorocentri]|uniref:DUF192 domain-containing protein n=1 Tax=Hoeflea prorocentri TaxID=1922333 RepID=A0A9X3UGX1_9HYPH|nr:DUF192 domain-containing protein [Hoeflea prorocentri]MCY6380618.1 DUF192 domain-containing protein [Hoeflea prorocentri]MDA5398418.1 DUF192 domain-containing protein [Hoeflea prorocentri]
MTIIYDNRAFVRAHAAVLAVLAILLSAGLAQALTAEDRLQVVTQTGTYDFDVELALTPPERAVGLMHRTHMDQDAGMLFRFDAIRPALMWMKNTLIPLDMIFIRPDGSVADIHRNAQPHSETVIQSSEPVRYVLELNAGVVDRIGLAPGDKVVHPIIDGN